MLSAKAAAGTLREAKGDLFSKGLGQKTTSHKVVEIKHC